jgi:hypothetical protein
MVKKLYKFDLKQHEKMRFMNVINMECPNGIKVMPEYTVSWLIARGMMISLTVVD